MKSIVLVLILCLLAGCSVGSQIDLNTNKQIKVAIYPTGGGSDTYYFIINTDGELIVEEGISIDSDLTQNQFISREYGNSFVSEKKNLLPSEIDKIVDLVNKIYEKDFGIDDRIFLDVWEIQILYDNKIIKYSNVWSAPQEIENLVDELINISPIEIDLRGFA